MQRVLEPSQLEHFYTDTATADQVRNFLAQSDLMRLGGSPVVVDVGGGHGFFARALQARLGGSVRVIDTDPASVHACEKQGTPAILGDALKPPIVGDEQVACFNLILHHLIGRTERETEMMQAKALQAWQNHAKHIFVTEYVYESPRGIGPRLIYGITKSKILSALARLVGVFVPSLRANTLGVGVRFRGHDEWVQFFRRYGFQVMAAEKGRAERVRLPRRLLLLTGIRRDTFVLRW